MASKFSWKWFTHQPKSSLLLALLSYTHLLLLGEPWEFGFICPSSRVCWEEIMPWVCVFQNVLKFLCSFGSGHLFKALLLAWHLCLFCVNIQLFEWSQMKISECCLLFVFFSTSLMSLALLIPANSTMNIFFCEPSLSQDSFFVVHVMKCALMKSVICALAWKENQWWYHASLWLKCVWYGGHVLSWETKKKKTLEIFGLYLALI